jgi:hypothetical protein
MAPRRPRHVHAPDGQRVTRYRHALWAPSPKWRFGYQWGAPLARFRERFPEKVKEHGAPLRVWDSDDTDTSAHA